MTSPLLDDLAGRIFATASLPPDDQAEALASILSSLSHAELAPFTAIVIGELVALRHVVNSLPRPSPAAAPHAS